MKRILCTILSLSILLCISGCSANVNDLISKGKYEDALALIEKNPDKYVDIYDEVRYQVAKQVIEQNDFERAIVLLTDNKNELAPTLLDTAYNSMTAVKIESFYKAMLDEIEDYNPDKLSTDFDYLETSDFYLRICDMLNEVNDIIVRDNKMDNAMQQFVDIFGYEPSSIDQAKNAIKQLYEDLEFETYYDSPFYYYKALHYVMDDLAKNSEFIRFELTETSGFVVVEKPYQFLQDKGLSAKTFAYLLGVCESMGATINRDSEKIIITFENTQSDSYYSRGYYYCAPNSQHTEILDFLSNLSFKINQWGADDIGTWMTVTARNKAAHNLRFLSINAILVNAGGKHIGTTSVLLKNVSDQEIVFKLDFDDITMKELKEKKCSVKFFPAVVIADK